MSPPPTPLPTATTTIEYMEESADPVAPAPVERPQRWDAPFDPVMSEVIVDRLLGIPPFCDMDTSRFPSHQSLRDILLNDTRVRVLSAGQIVVREGDYGNSAFLVLSGAARVILGSLPKKDLGRGETRSRSIFRTIAKFFGRSPWPETRVHHTKRRFAYWEQPGVFLQDVPGIVSGNAADDIMPGQLFGEIGALGRTQRVATVVASVEGTELLELRWQGLRDVMNFAPQFNERIGATFRQNGLRSLLLGLELMRRLPEEAVSEIVRVTKFERYGNFDWYGTYEQMRDSTKASERLQGEPLIIQEGDYINGLLIVRGGFVRVSQSYNQSEQTTSYLGKGQHFGLQEILHNSANPEARVAAQRSLRAVGYVDILLIPLKVVEEHILPVLRPDEIEDLKMHTADAPEAAPLGSGMLHSDQARSKLGAGIIEFFMDKRTINGSATMMIDLERCTRCDDCVRACASTHEGNPRFIRHGAASEGIMVTQACMHCHDPICMIPCPTGAIHRLDSGEVVVNDDTCIGCSRCANNCPYDNIEMVDIRDRDGNYQYPVRLNAKGEIVLDDQGRMIPLMAEGPIRRATKCDLCTEHVGGPACERACPHDALIRIDMQDTDRLASWIFR